MSQRLDAFSSQPWWQEIGHDAAADILKESIMDFSSDRNICFGSKIINLDRTVPLEEAGAQKLTGIGVILPQDGLFGSEQQQRQQASSSVLPSATTEGLVEPSKQEILDHSVAYGLNRFSESFYGGAMPAYLSEALPHLHCPVGHSSRAVLPLEVAEEPVYVNAKQYHGILRRRQSRAKAELKKKPVEVRRPYLHESRHLHAMRRARGCGGRFLSTKKLDDGSSSVNASTGRDSSMSSEKTDSMRAAIGSLTIK